MAIKVKIEMRVERGNGTHAVLRSTTLSEGTFIRDIDPIWQRVEQAVVGGSDLTEKGPWNPMIREMVRQLFDYGQAAAVNLGGAAGANVEEVYGSSIMVDVYRDRLANMMVERHLYAEDGTLMTDVWDEVVRRLDSMVDADLVDMVRGES